MPRRVLLGHASAARLSIVDSVRCDDSPKSELSDRIYACFCTSHSAKTNSGAETLRPNRLAARECASDDQAKKKNSIPAKCDKRKSLSRLTKTNYSALIEISGSL
jgi:hypothetical protein